MRVTDSMVFEFMRKSVADANTRFARAQEVASTGRSVLGPSDDPVNMAQAFDARSQESRADDHLRTIDRGISRLDLFDTTLDSMGETLRQVQEIAVQGATDTLNASDRQILAVEVEALRESFLGLANTESQGRYLFAGFTDNQPAFDAAGVYQGDGQVTELEVAPGVRLQAGVRAPDIFAPAGGVDIFQELEALQTALETNDQAGIQNAIGTVRSAHSQVSVAHASVGARTESFEVARDVADRVRVRAIETQNDLVGISQEDAFIDLNQAQTALQEAIALAGQLPLPSLLLQR